MNSLNEWYKTLSFSTPSTMCAGITSYKSFKIILIESWSNFAILPSLFNELYIDTGRLIALYAFKVSTIPLPLLV